MTLTVFASDPFDGHPVASPLVNAAAGSLSPYEHNRLGATPTGEEVSLSLFQGICWSRRCPATARPRSSGSR